jgi:mannosyltransferase
VRPILLVIRNLVVSAMTTPGPDERRDTNQPLFSQFERDPFAPSQPASRPGHRLRRALTEAARPLAARHLQVLAGLTVIAAFLRFSTLGAQSYWYDEAITVDLIHRSLPNMLAAIPGSESAPPLYYVLAWGWARLFGLHETGLRSLSAVFGTATVPAAYAAARVFVSRRSACFTAALVAVSPFLVWYSQEARGYAMLVFFGTLSVAFLRRASETRAGWWLAGWALSSALALATHYFAFFLLAAEAVFLLYRSADRRAVGTAVALVTLVAAALVPLAFYQARYTQHTAWIPASGGVVGRAAYFLHQLVVGAYPASHIRPILVAIPLVLIVGLLLWTERSERNGALLALVLGMVAVGAPLVLAVVADRFFGGRGDYFIFRNLIVATVPLTIPAAAAIGSVRIGKVGLVAAVVACLLLVGVSSEISRRRDLQKPDIRAVATALASSPSASRAILADVYTSLVLKLYLPQLRNMTEQRAYLSEIHVVEESDSVNAPRADLAPPPGFREVARQHIVQAFTIVRLQSPRRRLVTRASLAREFLHENGVAILLGPTRR